MIDGDLRVALRGVSTGAILDYGYSVDCSGGVGDRQIWLQTTWPVRLLRLWWIPSERSGSAWYVSRSDQFDIEVHYEDTLRGLNARDLPPVEREPKMPPWETVAATAHLYYPNLRNAGSWDRIAENRAHRADSFAGSESSARRMLEEMELPEGAGPHAKLEQVYEWMTEHVDNVTFRSTEEAFEAVGEVPETVRCAREVIRERQGDWWDLAQTYRALARHLGFEAHLVHAVNRQDRFLNLQYFSSRQFNNLFVATRWPDDPDDAWVFNEVGSKLPYGTVPWWNQGAQALMYTEQGAKVVSIPVSPATESVSKCKAEVSFDERDGFAEASWLYGAKGQAWLGARRNLYRMEPHEREEWLQDRCGSDPSWQQVDGDLPHPEDLRGYFSFRCEGESYELGVYEGAEAISFSIQGPWFEGIPDLHAGERVHPEILAFPRTVVTELTVKAPKGFRAARELDPVLVNTPFGQYSITIDRTEGGYRVSRGYVLNALAIPPERSSAFVDFLEAVRRADSTVLEFERID